MGTMIGVEIGSGRWAGISCPETSCKIKLQFEDIRAFADDENFERFAPATTDISVYGFTD
jgi:hypothetical protein